MTLLISQLQTTNHPIFCRQMLFIANKPHGVTIFRDSIVKDFLIRDCRD